MVLEIGLDGVTANLKAYATWMNVFGVWCHKNKVKVVNVRRRRSPASFGIMSVI